jgi:hypothetical protein
MNHVLLEEDDVLVLFVELGFELDEIGEVFLHVGVEGGLDGGSRFDLFLGDEGELIGEFGGERFLNEVR